MIHIVFQEADIEVLKKAQELDEVLVGQILQIKDDYAVGPLNNLHTPEGWQNRRNWWRMLLEKTATYNPDETLEMVDDKLTVHNLTQQLHNQQNEVVWIWAAQNKHDVSGYYWLISQLQIFQGRIFILYLNNLPFINEKGGIFYPVNLFEIQPKEFSKAKKLARPVTASEFELDIDEWKRICNEDKMVRLLEGGKKLIQAGEDYYDKVLQNYVSGDFTKASRILQQYYTKEKEVSGDVFILWRLHKMIEENGWEIRGSTMQRTNEYEVRNQSIAPVRKKSE